jgi:hypothetical protein
MIAMEGISTNKKTPQGPSKKSFFIGPSPLSVLAMSSPERSRDEFAGAFSFTLSNRSPIPS